MGDDVLARFAGPQALRRIMKKLPPLYLTDSPMMQRAAKSWGIVLTAKPHDLQDCKNALPPGGDPWVEVIEVDVVLRSAALDGMSLNQALPYAKQLVRSINGALLAMGSRTELDFEDVFEFVKGKRKPIRHSFPKMDWKSLSDMRPYDQKLARNKPPSPVQRWLAKANETPALADALMLLGGQLDWYDIYKVLECLEATYGGQHQFQRQRWVPRSYSKFRRVANSHRHWRRSDDELRDTITLVSARSQTVKLLRAALEDKATASSAK